MTLVAEAVALTLVAVAVALTLVAAAVALTLVAAAVALTLVAADPVRLWRRDLPQGFAQAAGCSGLLWIGDQSARNSACQLLRLEGPAVSWAEPDLLASDWLTCRQSVMEVVSRSLFSLPGLLAGSPRQRPGSQGSVVVRVIVGPVGCAVSASGDPSCPLPAFPQPHHSAWPLG